MAAYYFSFPLSLLTDPPHPAAVQQVSAPSPSLPLSLALWQLFYGENQSGWKKT